MNGRGDAPEPGGHDRRKARIAAEPDNGAGFDGGKLPVGRENSASKGGHSSDGIERAAPLTDRGRGDEIDLSRREIAAVAVPPHVSHQIDRVATPAELLRQRQRRKEMAASAAGREHHRGNIH